MGHSTWEAYARAEFGVCEASAYRLLDMAVVLEQLDQVAVDLGVSPFGDILEITRQQARELKGWLPEIAAVFADLLAERRSGLEPPAIVELLSAAVDKVRKARPVPAQPTTMGSGEERKQRFEYWLGTTVLGRAPAKLTDTQAIQTLRAQDPGLTTVQLAYDLGCRYYAREDDPGPLDDYFCGADVDTTGSPLTAERVGEGRRLAHRLRMLRWESGRKVLELAPPYSSDRDATCVLSQALGLDAQSDEVAEKLAERRFAMTGDYRAVETWEAEIRAR